MAQGHQGPQAVETTSIKPSNFPAHWLLCPLPHPVLVSCNQEAFPFSWTSLSEGGW